MLDRWAPNFGRAGRPTCDHAYAWTANSYATGFSRLLGIKTVHHYGMFFSSPMLTGIVAEQLFDTFRSAGLKVADAQHLMSAVHNGCDWFVTTDSDFLNRRTDFEKSCRGLRIVRPSELVAELGY